MMALCYTHQQYVKITMLIYFLLIQVLANQLTRKIGLNILMMIQHISLMMINLQLEKSMGNFIAVVHHLAVK